MALPKQQHQQQEIKSNFAMNLKAFPKEQENIFHSIPSNDAQCSEKLLISGKDRRTRVKKEQWRDIESRVHIIGIVRAKFCDKYFVGSGFALKQDKKDYFYVLTAAHNCVSVSAVDGKVVPADAMWFETRKNTSDTSTIKQRYYVTDFHVYPEYFVKGNANSHKGYDLAVLKCRAGNDKNLFNHKYFFCPLANEASINIYSTSKCTVLGYPAEKNGELWSMTGSDYEASNHREIVIYKDLDTTGGQSGSPVTDAQYDCISPNVIGVHTGGDSASGQNWGTRLTVKKIKWIAQMCDKNCDQDFYTHYIR